jgi:dimethylglycine dehydrogenase
VVIIGGGIAGCALLYYLARAGWKDLVLLEKDELTSGTTWHSAGYVTNYATNPTLIRIHRRSWEIYETLEAEVGEPTGCHRAGSLRITNTRDQITDFRRAVAKIRHLGIHAEVIGRAQLEELLPILDCSDALGGLYTREDGHTDPAMSTAAFAKGARHHGAVIHRHTRVRQVRTRRGHEWEVVTERGTIRAEVVVAAVGMWSSELGDMVGATLPVVPMERQNMVTESIPELQALAHELPVTRHLHGRFTFRQERSGLLIGLNDTEGEPPLWCVDGIPDAFSQELLPDDFDRVASSLESATRYVPVLGQVGVRRTINGPTSRTTDQLPLVGPVPGRDNFFVMGGFTAGITEGPAVAEQLAQWIVHGESELDLRIFDVRRFGPHVDKHYVCESLRGGHSHGYLVGYPNQVKRAGRPVRGSALRDRHTARGARFVARNGWECTDVFVGADATPDERPGFGRPQWTGHVATEQKAALHGVALADLTSMARYELVGSRARAALNRVIAGPLPRRAGMLVQALILTGSGGVQCHFTLARLARDRFYISAAASAQVHHLDCLRRALPASRALRLDDVTGRHGVLLLTGPRAREVMSRLTRTQIPSDAVLELRLGFSPVRVLRTDVTGGGGFELHHPLEYQAALYDTLMAAGEDLGITDMGMRALEGLRIEARAPSWGAELNSSRSPLEAGLESAVDLGKGEFVGREAVAELARQGVGHRLALVSVPGDGDAGWLWGGEPVRCAGQPAGFVTSAGYSVRRDRPVGLVYLPVTGDGSGAHAQVEVELPWGPCPATVLA